MILLDAFINDSSQWQLIFDEEFNSNSLDISKWELTVNQQGATDGQGSYNTLDNVVVTPETFYGENTSAIGVCRIVAKKEDVTRPPVSWNPSIPAVTYHYTTSHINTIQKFGWGKYEIRCKVPKGKGFWSAFWMYGEVNGEGHEIDVFEFANGGNIFGQYDAKKQNKQVMMNYHSADNSMPGNRIDHNCGYTFNSKIDYSLDYHTYAIIWNRFGVEWYIDGEYIKTTAQWYDLNGGMITQKNIKPAQVAMRNDWFPKNKVCIVVDMDIEKSKGTPDENTPFPSSFDIDYIKYYSY
ncbi:MAG: glycoside hydrolase family 16 protein [Bacteroidetes bacterium]|nr:glycoside hydrolase family 16 protein [Bacteroidota bacterium]